MKFKANIYIGSLYQLFITFLFFWSTRLIFIYHNADFIDVTSFKEAVKICISGARIDACIFAYFNSLFIIMRFAPLPWVYNRRWIAVSNFILYLFNTILLILNLGDTAYFPFTGYRMSWQGFMNVLSDPGTPGLLVSFFSRFWWIYLIAGFFIFAMIWLASRVRFAKTQQDKSINKSAYWIIRSVIFLFAGFLTFMCIRGWTGFKGRPLERATGVTLVDNIKHFSAVINTPFSIFFSMKSDVKIERKELFSPARLQEMRSSVIHKPDLVLNKKNLLVIIIESGGSIHSKIFNPVKGDSAYTRSLSFLDSLASFSLINRHLIASGRTSTQGITHIFTGMPYFGSSYLVESPYANNKFDSPANLLNREGYDTRFYYGCTKGNYHIDETMQLSGFKTVLSRESFNNDKEFDGKWGIWDLPMSDFVINDLTKAYDPRRPFFATWFTITAHEPNSFPKNEDVSNYAYPEPSPERAMEYTDKALRHFFDLARLQPWYKNTIFVITSDHGQRNYNSFHTNNIFAYSHIPFLIYAPDSSIEAGSIENMPMSQIDIAPTLLDLAGYNKPYLSFGTSIFDRSKPHYGIAESFGHYYIFGNKYIISVAEPGKPIDEVYDITETPYSQTPLKKHDPAVTDSMLNWFNALMQDFTTRINDDNLQFNPSNAENL